MISHNFVPTCIQCLADKLPVIGASEVIYYQLEDETAINNLSYNLAKIIHFISLPMAHFTKHGFPLITAWMSNYVSMLQWVDLSKTLTIYGTL